MCCFVIVYFDDKNASSVKPKFSQNRCLIFSDCICEFIQHSTPVPKQPSSHPAPFRTFERRTDDVPKTRHAVASTTANCGSIPKVFEITYDYKLCVNYG